jgi:hypothetical protein
MAFTANKLNMAIGQVVRIRIESWIVPMAILDAKSSYGQARVLVAPLNGSGSAWVDLSRIVTESEEHHVSATYRRDGRV